MGRDGRYMVRSGGLYRLFRKQANCLSPFREGTEKVPVFEKSGFIQLSISGCRELRQTDSNK